ncbi:MAG: SIS domain-containing protein [Planctomycetota bacterium]|jgi:phosphoheptose isomerase
MQKEITERIQAIIHTHNRMIAELQSAGTDTIVAAAAAITKALMQDGTVYICGNGGSAADAQHRRCTAHSR